MHKLENEARSNINKLARLVMVAKVWNPNAWETNQEFKVSLFYIERKAMPTRKKGAQSLKGLPQ